MVVIIINIVVIIIVKLITIIIESAGFINEVQAFSQPSADPKCQVTWARSQLFYIIKIILKIDHKRWSGLRKRTSMILFTTIIFLIVKIDNKNDHQNRSFQV